MSSADKILWEMAERHNTENPINAPRSNFGRPRIGKRPRISRTICVDEDTSAFISVPGVPAGRVVDFMALFCRSNGFNPAETKAK